MQEKSRIYALFFMLLSLMACTKENDDNLLGASNNLSLGFSSNDLLSDDKYSSIKVEVAYVVGHKPSTTTFENIKAFLAKHTHKPNGISIVTKELNPLEIDAYTIAEVKELEEENRSAFNSGTEIAVFILFIDGKSATQKDNKLVLGTAYKNTSMVVYEKTIRELSQTSGIQKSEIETTTIMHEFGHLFGLVNNGSPAQSQHEDSESKSHCNADSCLMLTTVEFGHGALKMIQTNQNFGFDENCLQDLRANGGK